MKKNSKCKVLCICSFKGGVGKTTTAIDLSAAFVKLGKKVVAIDSDGQGHLTIGFGFSKNQKATLKSMLENEIMGFDYDPKEAILHSEEGVGILQIPLTIVYFVLSLVGSIASGLGWFFGLIIFGVALVLCFFGEFDSTCEMLSVFGIAAALFIIPNFLVNLIGDGIILIKKYYLILPKMGYKNK